MPKNIRQKMTQAIQTTFTSPFQHIQSSSISKLLTCCSLSKQKDYEYITYVQKRSSINSDYIDLSECHSSCSSYSKDSGISFDRNFSSISSSSSENFHRRFQSTKILSDDSCSHLTLSNLSSITSEQVNLSKFDVTAWHTIPTSFQCCHCYCHHQINSNILHNPTNNYLYLPRREKRTKTQIFPFIF